MANSKITLKIRNPSVEEYCSLRVGSGLPAKSAEAAMRGIAGSLHAVVLENDQGLAVGMGRVIGDGGCVFNIVDIAVLPSFQKKGFGKEIMSALMNWIKANAPATALVTLLADGDAFKLYEKFGFSLSAPESQGMILRIR